MENINNVTLIGSQSQDGMRRAIEFRNKEFKERNIVTKDIVTPVKDKDGNPVKDKDGNPVMRIITIPIHIPEIEKQALKVFVDSVPCWFDGCQELRNKYKQELKENSIDEGCSSCKKGPIIRKYLKLAAQALQNLQ